MLPDDETLPPSTAVKLLLVDDQPSNLSALEAVLAPLGAATLLARSGTEALKLLLQEEEDFAAILLDVQMPGMDGFETARLIKERQRSRYTPILFITAAGDDLAFQLRAYQAGAVDFLPKPFLPEVLRAKIAVFVDLYRQREEVRRRDELLHQGEMREERLREEVRARERELQERERERQHLTELARREAEKAALTAQVHELSLRQRRFLREMLSSLTEGRLILCDTADDLPNPLPALSEPLSLTRANIRQLRHATTTFGEAAGWTAECVQDLETAVGEAAMNAVVHGHRAQGIVRGVLSESRAQVWITDEGGGIAEDALHRATLERGYTTAGTLGHGFWLMLKTADRVYLLTGESGTTVVLEQDALPPEPVWLRSLTIPVATAMA